MKRKIQAPTAVTIAILTLITVVFWIGFEVYRAFTTKPPQKVPEEILKPLDPTLDQTTLNRLQGRIHLNE